MSKMKNPFDSGEASSLSDQLDFKSDGAQSPKSPGSIVLSPETLAGNIPAINDLSFNGAVAEDQNPPLVGDDLESQPPGDFVAGEPGTKAVLATGKMVGLSIGASDCKDFNESNANDSSGNELVVRRPSPVELAAYSPILCDLPAKDLAKLPFDSDVEQMVVSWLLGILETLPIGEDCKSEKLVQSPRDGLDENELPEVLPSDDAIVAEPTMAASNGENSRTPVHKSPLVDRAAGKMFGVAYLDKPQTMESFAEELHISSPEAQQQAADVEIESLLKSANDLSDERKSKVSSPISFIWEGPIAGQPCGEPSQPQSPNMADQCEDFYCSDIVDVESVQPDKKLAQEDLATPDLIASNFKVSSESFLNGDGGSVPSTAKSKISSELKQRMEEVVGSVSQTVIQPLRKSLVSKLPSSEEPVKRVDAYFASLELDEAGIPQFDPIPHRDYEELEVTEKYELLRIHRSPRDSLHPMDSDLVSEEPFADSYRPLMPDKVKKEQESNKKQTRTNKLITPFARVYGMVTKGKSKDPKAEPSSKQPAQKVLTLGKKNNLSGAGSKQKAPVVNKEANKLAESAGTSKLGGAKKPKKVKELPPWDSSDVAQNSSAWQSGKAVLRNLVKLKAPPTNKPKNNMKSKTLPKKVEKIDLTTLASGSPKTLPTKMSTTASLNCGRRPKVREPPFVRNVPQDSDLEGAEGEKSALLVSPRRKSSLVAKNQSIPWNGGRARELKKPRYEKVTTQAKNQGGDGKDGAQPSPRDNSASKNRMIPWNWGKGIKMKKQSRFDKEHPFIPNLKLEQTKEPLSPRKQAAAKKQLNIVPWISGMPMNTPADGSTKTKGTSKKKKKAMHTTANTTQKNTQTQTHTNLKSRNAVDLEEPRGVKGHLNDTEVGFGESQHAEHLKPVEKLSSVQESKSEERSVEYSESLSSVGSLICIDDALHVVADSTDSLDNSAINTPPYDEAQLDDCTATQMVLESIINKVVAKNQQKVLNLEEYTFGQSDDLTEDQMTNLVVANALQFASESISIGDQSDDLTEDQTTNLVVANALQFASESNLIGETTLSVDDFSEEGVETEEPQDDLSQEVEQLDEDQLTNLFVTSALQLASESNLIENYTDDLIEDQMTNLVVTSAHQLASESISIGDNTLSLDDFSVEGVETEKPQEDLSQEVEQLNEDQLTDLFVESALQLEQFDDSTRVGVETEEPQDDLSQKVEQLDEDQLTNRFVESALQIASETILDEETVISIDDSSRVGVETEEPQDDLSQEVEQLDEDQLTDLFVESALQFASETILDEETVIRIDDSSRVGVQTEEPQDDLIQKAEQLDKYSQQIVGQSQSPNATDLTFGTILNEETVISIDDSSRVGVETEEPQDDLSQQVEQLDEDQLTDLFVESALQFASETILDEETVISIDDSSRVGVETEKPQEDLSQEVEQLNEDQLTDLFVESALQLEQFDDSTRVGVETEEPQDDLSQKVEQLDEDQLTNRFVESALQIASETILDEETVISIDDPSRVGVETEKPPDDLIQKVDELNKDSQKIFGQSQSLKATALTSQIILNGESVISNDDSSRVGVETEEPQDNLSQAVVQLDEDELSNLFVESTLQLASETILDEETVISIDDFSRVGVETEEPQDDLSQQVEQLNEDQLTNLFVESALQFASETILDEETVISIDDSSRVGFETEEPPDDLIQKVDELNKDSQKIFGQSQSPNATDLTSETILDEETVISIDDSSRVGVETEEPQDDLSQQVEQLDEDQLTDLFVESTLQLASETILDEETVISIDDPSRVGVETEKPPDDLIQKVDELNKDSQKIFGQSQSLKATALTSQIILNGESVISNDDSSRVGVETEEPQDNLSQAVVQLDEDQLSNLFVESTLQLASETILDEETVISIDDSSRVGVETEEPQDDLSQQVEQLNEDQLTNLFVESALQFASETILDEETVISIDDSSRVGVETEEPQDLIQNAEQLDGDSQLVGQSAIAFKSPVVLNGDISSPIDDSTIIGAQMVELQVEEMQELTEGVQLGQANTTQLASEAVSKKDMAKADFEDEAIQVVPRVNDDVQLCRENKSDLTSNNASTPVDVDILDVSAQKCDSEPAANGFSAHLAETICEELDFGAQQPVCDVIPSPCDAKISSQESGLVASTSSVTKHDPYDDDELIEFVFQKLKLFNRFKEVLSRNRFLTIWDNKTSVNTYLNSNITIGLREVLLFRLKIEDCYENEVRKRFVKKKAAKDHLKISFNKKTIKYIFQDEAPVTEIHNSEVVKISKRNWKDKTPRARSSTFKQRSRRSRHGPRNKDVMVHGGWPPKIDVGALMAFDNEVPEEAEFLDVSPHLEEERADLLAEKIEEEVCLNFINSPDLKEKNELETTNIVNQRYGQEPSFLKRLFQIRTGKRNKNSPIHIPSKTKLIHVLPIRVGYNATLEEQGHGLVEVMKNTYKIEDSKDTTVQPEVEAANLVYNKTAAKPGRRTWLQTFARRCRCFLGRLAVRRS